MVKRPRFRILEKQNRRMTNVREKFDSICNESCFSRILEDDVLLIRRNRRLESRFVNLIIGQKFGFDATNTWCWYVLLTKPVERMLVTGPIG